MINGLNKLQDNSEYTVKGGAGNHEVGYIKTENGLVYTKTNEDDNWKLSTSSVNEYNNQVNEVLQSKANTFGGMRKNMRN